MILVSLVKKYYGFGWFTNCLKFKIYKIETFPRTQVTMGKNAGNGKSANAYGYVVFITSVSIKFV